jgi:hypothetical protein
MKIVNTANTNHDIIIIPRYYSYENIVLSFNNETITCTHSLSDGLLSINFDYDFVEGDKFKIKIKDSGEVLYSGMIFATSQDTQTFKASNELYYYE